MKILLRSHRCSAFTACLAAWLLMALPPALAVNLADAPLFSTTSVPGNLALTLSVEFPTAVGAAHPDAIYSASSNYLGYFDPNKCYRYVFVDVESSSLMSHFAPAGVATSRVCSGANDWLWSGNFLNWATMQTIDPFRWAMTGGYRVVDIPSLTILEKAWASGQGGTNNFPDKVTSNAADIAGATPFPANGNLTAYVQGRGQRVNFVQSGAAGTGGMLATYFNGTNLDYDNAPATPVLTRTEQVNFDWGLGSPQAGVVNADNFSARWISSDTAPATGTYTFQVLSDDGARLWINGVKVIDDWNVQPAWYPKTVSVSLSAGSPLNVRLEYFEAGGSASIQLQWMKPGDSAYSVYDANGGYWYVPIRAKVCDPNAPGGVESNCKAYANGYYKPEGLMQQYANKVRYSVFGYLNDSNLYRDAGVLRTQQKFIGLTYPVPGASPVTNPAAEWDSTTGVITRNPDSTDAASTSTALGITIANSGALNYINKFGQITRGSYKGYDPVGELYYAALRYYKNQGNVPAWSDMSGADAPTKTTWADGFPVITSWNDPIQYSCQKNFILGIGDVNTHADKNVPGNTDGSSEPTMPTLVTPGDSTVNAVIATNKVGVLQGLGSSFANSRTYPNCCTSNAPYMAGLAYDANTKDIRPDLANMPGTNGQTVQTFWVDVLEGGYKMNNQFYLTAKYGGFSVPLGFDPYSASAALQTSWWMTTSDTVGSGSSAQPRPDNYYTAGRPDQMVSGLTSAFAKIYSQTVAANSTTLSFATPNEASSGSINYAAVYDPSTWTSSLSASTVSYDSSGNPTLTPVWDAGSLLDAAALSSRKVVTCCTSTGAALAFNDAALSTTTLSGRTYYPSFSNVPGASSQSAANFVAYLRGDRTQEQINGGAYRNRSHLLGDIVNSKVTVVAPPNAPYHDANNPGYMSFARTYKSRTTVVYAGANDGMLHAIDGSTGASASGSELFAYIPSFVYGTASTYATNGLAALGNPAYSHRYFVDATPLAFDVDLNRVGGNTTAGTSDWRSVLIGGLGKGGNGYYAIDVTDPSTWTSETAVASKVLWEFTDSTMGYSYGDARLVKTAKYGWTVVLTSGYNNADGKGYLYFVNPKTGALLEKVATPTGSTTAPINLVHVTAFIPDQTDYTATALYAGDMQGNVWRLDLSGTTGTYSAPTAIATFAMVGAPQAITTPVRVMIDPTTSKRYVMVGTGRLLDESDIASTQRQSFYALVDGTASEFYSSANLPSGVTFPVTRAQLNANSDLTSGIGSAPARPMGWYHDLGTDATTGIAQRITVMPTVSEGVIGVGVNLPTGDPCSPGGQSDVFAVGFADGKSVLTNSSGTVLATSGLASGLLSDIAFKNVAGRKRLYGGRSDGTVSNVPGSFRTGGSLQRLNWRQVPTMN